MLLSFNSNISSNIQDLSKNNKIKNSISFQSKTFNAREFEKDIRRLQNLQKKEQHKLLKTLREITEKPKNIFERFEFFLKKIFH